MKRSLGGMSPASGHHVGVKPASFSSWGKSTNHPWVSLETFGHYVGKKLIELIFVLSRACKKIHENRLSSLVFVLSRARKYMRIGYLSSVFVLSRAHKYMRIGYRVYFYHFFRLVKAI
jgi:hypothetical protein